MSAATEERTPSGAGSGARPAVTVLIATRDRLQLVRRALQSIWDQEYDGPVHVVLVFDGPIPDEVDLPAPTAAGWTLEVVTNEAKPGVAGARNTGLAHARTALVALLDDDDAWLPGKLTAQVAMSEANPTSPAIGGGIRVVTSEGTRERLSTTRVDLNDLLESRIMELHTSTLLMRRDALVETGGWDESLPGGFAEDYDLLLRLARDFGPIHLVDGMVADIHWNVKSFYRNRWEMIAEALEVMLEKFPEFASNPRGLARMEGQLAFAYAALGSRKLARHWIRRALSHRVAEPRTILAGLLLTRLVTADQIQRALNARGRGI